MKTIFSNLLIIHKEKTKKITGVQWWWLRCRILITIKIFELCLWISPRIIVHLRSYIQNSTQCFFWYPHTSKSVLKNSAALRFSTHFSVSGHRMKHCMLILIYYMNNRFYKINARDLIIWCCSIYRMLFVSVEAYPNWCLFWCIQIKPSISRQHKCCPT